MKRKLLVAVPLLLAVVLLAWIFRPKHETLGDAYVSERTITLWSGVAQVREPLGVLLYGDHVEVLARRNENVKVRTSGGVIGWVDGRNLMEPELWQRSEKLLKQAQAMPLQARGRTKVSTNLRAQPGRTEPRIYQFTRGVPWKLLVAPWPIGCKPPTKKKLLMRQKKTRKKIGSGARRGHASSGRKWHCNSTVNTTTQPGDQAIPIAGWLVARFITLDLPDEVRSGTESANIRPVAWFELNRVTDAGGEHPQYLVAGTRGPEGQPCDFTTMRVFTWNPKKSRYETAYIENNLCGALPIRVGKGPKGEPEFRFHEMQGAKQGRVYHLIQTVVRRIREEGSTKKSAARATHR